MRVYGRDPVTKQWSVVQTQANGSNDYVYITALCQCLKLNLNESPFWANWGIPAQQSVATQIFPDFYVSLMQQRFAQYFAALSIIKQPGPSPVYDINVTNNQGTQYQVSIPT
jgi:hypothetical protein